MPLEDRIQAGILAVVVAIERFDPTRGTRLTTYLGPVVERAMRRLGRRTPRSAITGSPGLLTVGRAVPSAPPPDGGGVREATELVSRWLTQWTVPVESIVAVEHPLAMDRHARHVAWDAPDAFIRGRLDPVSVDGPHATVLDWKSGWVNESEEGLTRLRRQPDGWPERRSSSKPNLRWFLTHRPLSTSGHTWRQRAEAHRLATRRTETWGQPRSKRPTP